MAQTSQTVTYIKAQHVISMGSHQHLVLGLHEQLQIGVACARVS